MVVSTKSQSGAGFYMDLKFGIFDHMERQRGVTLDREYAERLALIARADELGFTGYHLAEHHHAPLCMAPSQSVFLAAASRETSRIKLGTLVYLLPFYHPVRLIEEICMLDNLTRGRLMVGVGRGITAIEHTYWGWRPEEAQERYDEVFEILLAGLTSDTLNFHGKYYNFHNLPLEMEPFQKPYPDLWYAGTPDNAARYGMNFVIHDGPRVSATIARYKEVFEEARRLPGNKIGHVTHPVLGTSRHIFVAETDREADAIARASWAVYQNNFAKRGMDGPGPITLPNGTLMPVPNGGPATELARNFDHAMETDLVLVGSPETIRRRLATYPEEVDYYMIALQWGSLTHEQAMRSLELFGREVIPHIPRAAANRSNGASESAGK